LFLSFGFDQRLRQSGAFITSTESILLQLVRDAAHPQFKAVQALIKTAPDASLAASGLHSAFP
jgi:hypothetical protein